MDMKFSKFDYYFFGGLSSMQYNYSENTVDFWNDNQICITLGKNYYQYYSLTNILKEY
jgi:hypothetical protein